MYSVDFLIPDGYEVKENYLFTDIESAYKILSTRKQRKYTCASRDGLNAILVSHQLVCPYCNYKVPAYERFIKSSPYYWYYETPFSKRVIAEWCTTQLSFLEDNQCGKLDLSKVYKPTGTQVCKKCGRESLPMTKKRRVSVCYNKNKLEISAEVLGVAELMAIPWKTGKCITLELPLFEKVTFNLKKGHTHISLSNAKGEAFSVIDITEYSEVWHNGAVYKLLASNVNLSRTIKRYFEKRWHGGLPYGKREMDPDKYILLTRFIGFDRSFYDSIPYESDGIKIAGNFKSVAKSLHSIEMAEQRLINSGIPKAKSVRRIVCKNCGMLFYLRELELLYGAVKDVNIYCKVLLSKYIYDILATLKQRPAVIDFFADYRRIKGSVNLYYKCVEKWYKYRRYAVNYSSMGTYLRAIEQATWTKNGPDLSVHTACPVFSLPMHIGNGINDCVIDGFSFIWLRNGKDCLAASKALHNCLSHWSVFDNPVVCIKQGGKVVGAIEVSENVVIQARGEENSDISENTKMYSAYQKWKKRFGLKNCGEDDEMNELLFDDFDVGDDLPF